MTRIRTALVECSLAKSASETIKWPPFTSPPPASLPPSLPSLPPSPPLPSLPLQREDFVLYTEYCTNYDLARACLQRQTQNDKDFENFVKVRASTVHQVFAVASQNTVFCQSTSVIQLRLICLCNDFLVTSRLTRASIIHPLLPSPLPPLPSPLPLSPLPSPLSPLPPPLSPLPPELSGTVGTRPSSLAPTDQTCTEDHEVPPTAKGVCVCL